MTVPADPNWLYSTIAQSAAALVAIIGGLLVSRLVALSADHGSLNRRREEASKKLAIVATRRDSERNSILIYAQECFDDHFLGRAVAMRGELPEDDDFLPLGTPDDGQVWREELTEKVRVTFLAVESLMRPNEISIQLTELRRRGLSSADFSDRLVEMVADQIAGERRPKDRFDLSNLGNIAGMGLTFGGSINPKWGDHQRARIDRYEELNEEVRLLLSEIAILDSQLDAFVAPSGVRWGIAALVGFSILGIVYPMCLLAKRPVPAGAWVRGSAILSFVLGLGLVVLFIISQVRGLKAQKRQAPEVQYQDSFRY